LKRGERDTVLGGRGIPKRGGVFKGREGDELTNFAGGGRRKKENLIASKRPGSTYYK